MGLEDARLCPLSVPSPKEEALEFSHGTKEQYEDSLCTG